MNNAKNYLTSGKTQQNMQLIMCFAAKDTVGITEHI